MFKKIITYSFLFSTVLTNVNAVGGFDEILEKDFNGNKFSQCRFEKSDALDIDSRSFSVFDQEGTFGFKRTVHVTGFHKTKNPDKAPVSHFALTLYGEKKEGVEDIQRVVLSSIMGKETNFLTTHASRTAAISVLQALESKGIWTAISKGHMTADSENEFNGFGYTLSTDSLTDDTSFMMRPHMFFKAISTHLNSAEIVEPHVVLNGLSTSPASPYTYSIESSRNSNGEGTCFLDGPIERESRYSVNPKNKGSKSINPTDGFVIYSYRETDHKTPAGGLVVLRDTPYTYGVNFLNNQEKALPFLHSCQAFENSGTLLFVSDVGDTGFKLTPLKVLQEYGYTFSAHTSDGSKAKLFFNPLTTWATLLNAHRNQGAVVGSNENNNNNNNDKGTE